MLIKNYQMHSLSAKQSYLDKSRTISIPFNMPYIVGKELSYIAQAVLVEAQTAGDGIFTKKSNAWLEKRLDCPKALITHSCTAALEMAAILCDIQPGDEVVMPSFTFVSTANAFVLRGGVPVFVDIRPDSLNIDSNLIENAITEKTKAIVPVHYAGNSCDMNEIMTIAQRHGVMVVEDAAQALLSTYKGRCLGTIGDIGCISFHETKNIISGEGGAILLNNLELVKRAEIIREKGTDRSKFFRGEVDKYTWQDIGSSYLPSEITAAFLWAQLEMADKIIAKRSRLYRLYLKLLSPLSQCGHIGIPNVGYNCKVNGHMFYILTKNLSERNELTEHLKCYGINAVFHYIPLHSSKGGLKFGRSHGGMNYTDNASECLLRLPLFYEMKEEDIETVVEVIKDYYNH
jgi:dTDP-4-amino-4,6-dideoxygalactose transaminase